MQIVLTPCAGLAYKYQVASSLIFTDLMQIDDLNRGGLFERRIVLSDG